jgi:hypothetical protein
MSGLVKTMRIARWMAFVALLAAAVSIFAEISPTYYREMQQKAPEQLRIKVVDFSRDWYFWRSERKAKVIAEVTAVVKSATGLAKGNRVYFEYVIVTPPGGGWAGPRSMPELSEGAEYDFFGERVDANKDKGIILTPTARGYSFESLL